jgi:hypothetical protein
VGWELYGFGRCSVLVITGIFKFLLLLLLPHIYSTTAYKQHKHTHIIEDEAMNDDDISLSDDNATQSGSLTNDNSITSEEYFGFEESFLLTPLSHLLKVITHVSPQASTVLHL